MLMLQLFQKTVQGSKWKYAMWPVGWFGYLVQDIGLIALDGDDYPDTGMQQLYSTIWFFTTIILMVCFAKKLGVVAVRGMLVPLLSVGIFSMLNVTVLMPIILKGSGGDEKWMLFYRLAVWPIVTEVFCAPIRLALRGLPEDSTTKAGMTLALVPMVCGSIFFGRMLVYKLQKIEYIIVCNVVLCIVEYFARVSVGERDKLYTRFITRNSKERVKQIFQYDSSVQFRCNNLQCEMMCEYVAMFVLLAQELVTKSSIYPWQYPDEGMLLANFMISFVLELGVDCLCVRQEANKSKLPVQLAWKLRVPNFALRYAFFCAVAITYTLLFLPELGCPMRTGEGLLWVYC